MPAGVEEYEVVVVGAGPGGLASAVTLASYGVDTLVVERRPEPSILPRATSASTATMELLRRWGLEDAARRRSIDAEMRPWAAPSLAAAAEGHPVEAGFPTREQAALVSPTAPAVIGQDELEPLLEERLRTLEGARLERGVELVALRRDREGGYLLELAGPGEGRRAVRARYVIGADGMRSKVREALGITIDATEDLAHRLSITFRAPLWDLVGDHRNAIYFLTKEPEGRAILPVGNPDRWTLAIPWDAARGDVDLASGTLKRWVRDAAGDPALPIDLEGCMTVSYGIGLAKRFRDGDAFLVGDAAHRVTPRGATGLNTAIHDGFDIGWKLAWVLRRWAGGELLDSYERERRPVAEFNAARSGRSDGSILGASIGLNADIGGRIAHVWVPRDERLVSTLDLLGDGLTLYAGPKWSGPAPSTDPGSPPVRVERLDAIAARGLGVTPTGALLARPDGYPVGLYDSEDRLCSQSPAALVGVGEALVDEPHCHRALADG